VTTPSRWQVATALLAVWILWGSTFLGIRVVVAAVPPLLAAGLRFTVAGAVLLALVARPSSARPPLRQRLAGHLPQLVLLGILHFLVANGLVSIAERKLPSAAAGAYFATVPLWVLAIRVLTGRRTNWRDLLAAGLGVVGVGLLLGVRTGDLLSSLEVLVAAAVWAYAGYLAGRPVRDPRARSGSRPDTATAAAVQMLAGGMTLLLASGVTGEWAQVRVDGVSGIVWLAGAYLVVFGSLVGFGAYLWLVSRVDQRLASTYAYVNPLVAVLLGTSLLDERLVPGALAGIVLIVVAVAVTVLDTSRTTVPAAGRTTVSSSTLIRSEP
jgi:drug/metabolite transporter (DMT)-like permease